MTQRPVLGIDLGTTYSCVAHLDRYGKAAILPNADGDNTTPSVVYIDEGGNVVVGKDAKNELRRQPDRVFQLIKRKMGVPGFVLELDGRRYVPAQISAMILESVVRDALVVLGTERPPAGHAADVVITVPAYVGEAERAAREAGKPRGRGAAAGLSPRRPGPAPGRGGGVAGGSRFAEDVTVSSGLPS